VIFQTLLAGITYPLAMKSQDPKLMLVHKGNVAVMLALSTTTIFAGFTDLSAFALCAINSIVPPSGWIAVGSFLSMQLALAQGVEGLKVYLWWVGRKVKAGAVVNAQGKAIKIKKLDGLVTSQERSDFKV
jgi:hypothetical protein